jgi:hypothetical protein
MDKNFLQTGLQVNVGNFLQLIYKIDMYPLACEKHL